MMKDKEFQYSEVKKGQYLTHEIKKKNHNKKAFNIKKGKGSTSKTK